MASTQNTTVDWEEKFNQLQTELNTLKSENAALKQKLESSATENIKDNDIDNILDEIEEKENDTDTNVVYREDVEETVVADWIGESIYDVTMGTYIGDEPNWGAFCYDVFRLLFISEKKKNFKQNKNNTKNPNWIAPFKIPGDNGDELSEEQVKEIFTDILQCSSEEKVDIIKYKNEEVRDIKTDIGKWFIQIRKDPNRRNQKEFDKIYDKLKRYGCWLCLNSFVSKCDLDKALEHHTKYQKYININQQNLDCDLQGTLLHTAVDQEKGGEMIDWLLSLKIDINVRSMDYGKPLTALEQGKELQYWDHVAKLQMASMNDKMRERSDETVARLNKSKGMIKQWFRFFKCDNKSSDEYKTMNKMCDTIKTLIKNRLPISDDILLLCFQFELKQNNYNALNTSIWKCLYHTLNEILRIPLNRRNWLWFKQYLLNSTIWYQTDRANDKDKDGNTSKLLYDYLIEMVSKQLQAQKDYLRPFINKLEGTDEAKTETQENDNSNGNDWKKIKNYKEFIVTENPEGLRQDYVVQSGTGKELLPFPIRAIFTKNQLTRLNNNVRDFDCISHYDVRGYLSKLVLVAHSLNQVFHQTMRNIFKIDPETDKNLSDGVTYLEGPVKTIARAQAKAETDYSHCSYPTTAKVVDFVRCCLMYNNPRDLLKGIDKFVNFIKSPDNKVPLKKILRLKNMFQENKRENGGEWDLFRYADIKMGVLMVHDGQSMIVEVQFLLDFMLNARSLGFGLYEIEREQDFVSACYKIFEMDNGDLDTMVRSACMSGDENKLATLLLREAPVDIIKRDDEGFATIHHSIQRGHRKILKLLLDTKQADATEQEFTAFINLKGESNQTPVHHCIDAKQPDCLGILLKYAQVDLTLCDDSEQNPLFMAAYYSCHTSKGKGEEVWEMLKSDKRIPIKGVDDSQNNLLHHVVANTDDIEYAKTLWETGYFSINAVDDNDNTYLINAAMNNRPLFVKWLLTLPGININLAESDGTTAIDYAINYRYKEIVQMIYDRKDFDWKAGKRNKFVAAIEMADTKDIHFCEWILKLFPECDINGVDIGNNEETAATACIHKPEVFKWLLSLDGFKCIDKPNGSGETAWMLACQDDDLLEIAKLLWQRKDIDHFRLNESNKDIVHEAKEYECKRILAWLTEIGYEEKMNQS